MVRHLRAPSIAADPFVDGGLEDVADGLRGFRGHELGEAPLEPVFGDVRLEPREVRTPVLHRRNLLHNGCLEDFGPRADKDALFLLAGT